MASTGLNSTVSAILAKSPGSVKDISTRIRRSQNGVRPEDCAQAVEGLQVQIDAIVQALRKNPTVLSLSVLDTAGALIGWLGNQVTNGISYMGAWFKQLYIGGTSPATAKITADADGNVTISGATLTLNSNGVTTTIQNTSMPPFVFSIESLENATGYYSALFPQGLLLIDGSGNVLGSLRSGGSSGNLQLTNAAGTKTVYARTGGGGSPGVGVSDATYTATVGAGTFGNDYGTIVDTSGNVSAASYAAAGSAGIDATDTMVKAITPVTAPFVNAVPTASGAFVTSISVSTSTISYTPGASTATFVDGVSASTGGAITSVSPATANALTAAAPTTQTNTYTKGIRTA